MELGIQACNGWDGERTCKTLSEHFANLVKTYKLTDPVTSIISEAG